MFIFVGFLLFTIGIHADDVVGRRGNDTIQTVEILKFIKNFTATKAQLKGRSNIASVVVPRAPPSLSILMNFKNDGTTALQIYENNRAFWTDNGLCRHGQMFDPNINMCRDVFCTEGYVYTKNGCELDKNANNKTSQTHTKRKTIQDEIKFEMTILNQLCVYSLNDSTSCCSNIVLMTQPDEFQKEFQIMLSKSLKITPKRIKDLQIKSNDQLNDTFIFPFSLTNTNSNTVNFKPDNKSSYVQTMERIRLQFTIEDNTNYPLDDDVTLLFYFSLFKLNMDYVKGMLFGKEIAITNVTEIQSTIEWCAEPDVKIQVHTNEFILIPEFHENGDLNKYFIYLNDTDTLYKTGDYFLSINYLPQSDIQQHLIDLKINKNLEALSQIIAGNGMKFIRVNMTLTVCNREAKIRTQCPEHKTVRIKICELMYHLNRTYCYKQANKCYSVDEYEYDAYKPERYLRVCKFDDTFSRLNNVSIEYSILSKFGAPSSIAGYFSFGVNILSLIAMIATLVTFALFGQLRNIPGWNCINLTLALFVAQFSFLIGSLVVSDALVCFIVAILTHYGFLTAFSWMNVIAFDFYRNFHFNSRHASHVLLSMVNVKRRIFKYCLFAWLSPLAFVILCVLLDYNLNVHYTQSVFKPCYASYLTNCTDEPQVVQMRVFRRSAILERNPMSDAIQPEPCESEATSPLIDSSIFGSMRYCWIKNGKANLLYFGAPIGIIIITNAILFLLTILNIRKIRVRQKLRRNVKSKTTDSSADVMFFIRIAAVMGFTWTIGFFFSTFSSGTNEGSEIVNEILTYIFILCNTSTGLFIFIIFIFKQDVKKLYIDLIKTKIDDFKRKRRVTPKPQTVVIAPQNAAAPLPTNRSKPHIFTILVNHKRSDLLDCVTRSNFSNSSETALCVSTTKRTSLNSDSKDVITPMSSVGSENAAQNDNLDDVFINDVKM